MDFRYIGYSSDKKLLKGTITAATEEVAAKLLSSHGYQLYSLKQVPPFMPDKEQLFPSLFKIKPQTIILFSRQLALLLESGNDIVTSLELLRAQTRSPYFKRILNETISELRGGSKLSLALSKHKQVFSNIYIQTISVGEQSGNLEQVLRQVADYMEKDAKTAKRIKGALRYPMIVSITAVIVIGILITFVLPAFANLYKSLGAELPPLTQMTMSLFEWLRQNGTYIMGVIVAIMVIGYLYTKTPDGRLTRDKLMLKVPLLGQVTHLDELVRCCRTVSVLYRAGQPLLDIMTLAIENCNNLVIKNALSQVQQDLLGGECLSKSMTKSPYFLPMMIQMVSVGETTGNLDTTLLATAQNYETEVEDRMDAFVGSIQPILTVVIGAVVAVIALSMITAMYSVYGKVL